MNRSDILVPVNLEKDSLDGMKFAVHVADELSLHATLLHVVELNIFPLDRRIYDEVCLEYQRRLENIAGCLPGNFRRLRVRIGRPHKEIVAEARDSGVELIVMGAPKNNHRRWPFRSTNVERVVRDAPCRTLIIPEPWRARSEHYHLPAPLFDRTHREVMVQ
jgi:nucleotide-binding universal stress UspA family protein